MVKEFKMSDEHRAEAEIAHVRPLPQRLLRLPEVMHRVGLRRSAIYQRMSEGRFPKSRTLGPKCTVWLETEINAWVADIARSSNSAD